MHRLAFDPPEQNGVWKDIVTDYLDIKSNLDVQDQKTLLQALNQGRVQATSIRIHPCFSIQGRLIIILECAGVKEYLIYSSEKRKLTTLIKQG